MINSDNVKHTADTAYCKNVKSNFSRLTIKSDELCDKSGMMAKHTVSQKHSRHFSCKQTSDFNNFWAEMFLTNYAIKTHLITHLI